MSRFGPQAQPDSGPADQVNAGQVVGDGPLSPPWPEGTTVRVRSSFPPGHVRTPAYIRGRRGRIHRFLGAYLNAEELAYGRSGEPAVPLYRVRFALNDVWRAETDPPPGSDGLILDLYEHWLEPMVGGDR